MKNGFEEFGKKGEKCAEQKSKFQESQQLVFRLWEQLTDSERLCRNFEVK